MSHLIHAPVRVVRDRATLVSYASMAGWSWFVYGLGAVLVFLRDEQDSAAWLQGFHGTTLAAGGVIGALLAPRMINRFGRGLVMRMGVIGAAVCILIFLAPVPAAVWTLTAVFLACLFGNLIVVCVNAFLATHQGPAAPAAFTESTGLAALMGLLAPLAIGVAASTFLGWRTGILIGVVGFVVIEFARGNQLVTYGEAGQVQSRKTSGVLPPLTYWALAGGTAYIGAEFCIALWGATLLQERTGMSDAASAAGLAAFLGGVFVGRAFGSSLARRISSERLLRASLTAGIVMFFAMWLSTLTWMILVAFFATGAALALAWPLSMSRIIRAAGGRPDRASSLALACTTAAIGLAPFLLGGLAESMAVHQAFLLVPVLIAVSLFIVLFRPVAELVPEMATPAQ